MAFVTRSSSGAMQSAQPGDKVDKGGLACGLLSEVMNADFLLKVDVGAIMEIAV